MSPGSGDTNGLCANHSGVKVKLKDLEEDCGELKSKYRELCVEIGVMRKWLLGFMVALLLGVYANLFYQWQFGNSEPSAKALTAEIVHALERNAIIHSHDGKGLYDRN